MTVTVIIFCFKSKLKFTFNGRDEATQYTGEVYSMSNQQYLATEHILSQFLYRGHNCVMLECQYYKQCNSMITYRACGSGNESESISSPSLFHNVHAALQRVQSYAIRHFVYVHNVHTAKTNSQIILHFTYIIYFLITRKHNFN